MIALRRSHNVGSLVTIRRQGISVCNGETQRTSIGDAPDAVRFPSAHDQLRPSRHVSQKRPPVSNRQIVAVAELNHMRDVEGGEAPLQKRLVRVLQAVEAAQPGYVLICV